MPDIFVSYKSEDRPRAAIVAEALKQEGFDVWWDPALAAGEDYQEVIDTNLREALVVIVLWSPSSVKSRWVRSEATVGDQYGALAPAKIAKCELPTAFVLVQTADLSEWRGEAADPKWREFVGEVRAKRDRRRAAAVQSAAPPPDANLIESIFWQSIVDSSEAADFESYLKRYPNGHFVDLAQRRRAKLGVAPAPAPIPAPVRRAEPVSGIEPEAADEAPKSRAGLLRIGAGIGVAAALGAAAFFVAPMLQHETPPADAAVPTSAPAVVQPAPSAGGAPPVSAPAAPEMKSASASQVAPAPAAPTLSPARPAAADPATALAAIGQITAREWSLGDYSGLAKRVLVTAKLNELRAAAEHDVRAQTLLYWAIGAGSDEQYAALQKATAQGFPPAVATLAFSRFYFGDKTKAIPLYQQAASQGNAMAQYELALLYGRGEIVPRDPVESARLCRLAADQGHTPALDELADMTFSGRGVTQDYAQALRLYRQAASQGDGGRANTRLGEMYEKGLGGVKPDMTEAVRLYRLSASQGWIDAPRQLARLGVQP